MITRHDAGGIGISLEGLALQPALFRRDLAMPKFEKISERLEIGITSEMPVKPRNVQTYADKGFDQPDSLRGARGREELADLPPNLVYLGKISFFVHSLILVPEEC